jgi:NAD(P)H-dependent flavin oxidoreductase YrpB (nitropropane dioxygenase family)
VLRTPFHDEWVGRADELAQQADRLGPEVVRAVLAGEGHQYVPFAGQSVGLVHEILPAAEIVRSVVADAERILAELSSRYGQAHTSPRSIVT